MIPQTGVEVEVEVEDEAWATALPDCMTVVERAADVALEGAGGASRALPKAYSTPPPSLPFPPGGGGVPLALTILLTSDEAVRDLNARFRGRDKPTNVLSFPAPPSAHPHLGDIALAYGVCAAEAADQGKPLARHLMHLTVHGVLHLLGYDHESDAEAEDMEGTERAILAMLGVPDPYAHRDPMAPEANA